LKSSEVSAIEASLTTDTIVVIVIALHTLIRHTRLTRFEIAMGISVTIETGKGISLALPGLRIEVRRSRFLRRQGYNHHKRFRFLRLYSWYERKLPSQNLRPGTSRCFLFIP